MKKILFSMLLVIISGFVFSQTTYYYVGGLTPATFATNTNWNTQLNGLGTTRAAEAANDILIFDGTNVGGTTPTTGQVIAPSSGTRIFAQLKLINGANVVIGRTTAGSGTLTLNGDGTAADDLVIDASSTLTLGGPLYNYDMNILMVNPATGLIDGTVYLSPLSSVVHTRSYITVPTGCKLTFGTGAACHITDSTATSGFNSSVSGGITFKTGASLYYYSGRSPIGNNSSTQFIVFEPGSNCYIRANNYLSSSSWSGSKQYANLIIQNGSTFTCDGTFNRIEGLTIDNGCTLITHTSGATPLLGNLLVNGTLTYPVAGSTNSLTMGGNIPQTISGTGTITVPTFTVANYSDVTLLKSIRVDTSCSIYGKINFGAGNQITGISSFTAKTKATAVSVTGNTTAGGYQITGIPANTLSGNVGLSVTGAGIDPATNVIHTTSGSGVLTMSKPAIATATGVTVTFASDSATLITANPNGMDTLSGSVIVTGTKSFQEGTNYIINAATLNPVGISSGNTTGMAVGNLTLNAPVTTNYNTIVTGTLTMNTGNLTIRPTDTLRISSGNSIAGSPGSSKYVVCDVAGNNTGVLRIDNISAAKNFPIGTVANYLPVTLTPDNTMDLAASVFTGITLNGTPSGTPFSAALKASVVDAVWNIKDVNGTGNTNLQLGWDAPLEGSTFTTLPNNEIGLIQYNGTNWNLPIGTGNNTTNTVTASVSSYGAFSAGAIPQVSPFVFNPIPAKTYGDADFSAAASSLNTTEPILYTSSNPLVATVSTSGVIHIVGEGSTDITASQATDGFYAAASITNTFIVNKAALTIKADNKVKFVGTANPPLTITYTGFVLGENETVLLTPAVIATTAVLASPIGPYPITVTGATAANYNITFQDGILNVIDQAMTFNPLPTKTYGDADFSGGATSLNITQPITYTSDNPTVATIVANNIHIVGIGTALITASQETDGTYPFSSQSRTLTVNKAPLTITADNKNKYQGNANPPLTVTYTGFVLGEDEAVLLTPPVVTTTATISSPEGSYPIEVSGATAANYEISFVNGILLIQNHISFNLLPVKVYGDADFSGGATSLNTTQPLVYSSNNPLVATIVGGNIHITGSGTADITVTQQTDGVFPTVSVTRTLTVNKAALTITADNKTRYEGVANPTFTVSYAGFVLGENAGVLLTPPVAATTATIASPPGTYPITVTGATAANYNITFASGVLTIIPKLVQTITFNPLPTKTYGNSDFAGGATSTNAGIPVTYTSSNTSVATIIGSNIHIVGAGTCNITASQAGSDEYLPAPDVIRALVINKAALTIKADNKSKYEGSANPLLTVTYTGFVLGETETVLQTAPVIATTATVSSPPGTYPITVSNATATNYTITFTSGTLTVLPKIAQTITFNAFATKTYGNIDFPAGATSTNTTIPITYTSSNTAVATIIGTNIHITGAGTANITASQAGNDVYIAAADVMKVLTVNKAALTIRANDTTKVVGEVNPVFRITYTGFVLSETVANLTTPAIVTTTAFANSSPGYYVLTAEGATSANYTFTYLPGRLTIYPATGTGEQYVNAFQNGSGTLTVRVFSNKPALGDVLLTTIGGVVIAKKNLFMPVGFNSTELPISTLASGIYIVKVIGRDVNLTKMIEIMR